MHSVRLGTHEIDLIIINSRHADHLPSHRGRRGCFKLFFFFFKSMRRRETRRSRPMFRNGAMPRPDRLYFSLAHLSVRPMPTNNVQHTNQVRGVYAMPIDVDAREGRLPP